MLLIEGAVRLLPLTIAAEGGVLQQAGEKESAVILFIQTSSGEFQIVIPPENIDAITEAMQKAKEESEAAPKTDLVVAKNMSEADSAAAVNRTIKG